MYADGKLIYQLDAVPGIWGNTPGWTWNIVRFSSNVSSLQVQFTPCYPETAGQQKTFYIDGGYNIYRWVMDAPDNACLSHQHDGDTDRIVY